MPQAAERLLPRLLPPQTTELECAVVQAAPSWDGLAELGSNLTTERPAGFAAWLAAEWELGQFADLFESTESLIDAGLPWLFERGSAASVRRVLGWLGFDANVRIEEDGAFLHIDLGRIAKPDEMSRLAKAVRASLPAHMRFYRVFFAYDLRPVRLDHGPAVDAGLLDDDSGVWVATGVGDLKASFAALRGGAIEAPSTEPIGQAITAHRTALLSYDDRLLLDAWRLDSHLLVDSYGGLQQLYTGTCNAPQPGAPERIDGIARIGAAAWNAPQPIAGATAQRAERLPVAVLPPRAWRGPWAGPWRLSIELKRTEET